MKVTVVRGFFFSLFRNVTRLDEWREENRGFEFVAVGGGGIGLVAKRGRALCLFSCDERSKASRQEN